MYFLESKVGRLLSNTFRHKRYNLFISFIIQPYRCAGKRDNIRQKPIYTNCRIELFVDHRVGLGRHKVKTLRQLIADNRVSERPRLIVNLLILVIWVWIEVTFGFEICGLFGIILGVMYVTYRPRLFKLIATLALGIVFVLTPALITWTQLALTYVNTAQHLDSNLANIFSPNSGKEVLPDQVQQMLSLLQLHHILDYRLSKQIEQDSLLDQRIIESAWPIRMESKSLYLLCLIEEIKSNPTCVSIDQSEDVALEYCD